jgi:hypothetical protein
MTKSPETFDNAVIRSSVTPSLKYSWAGSWLRFVNGSTATDGLSGRVSPARSADLSQRQPAQLPAARSNATAASPTARFTHRRLTRRPVDRGADGGSGSR